MRDRCKLVDHYIRAYGLSAICLMCRRGRFGLTAPVFVRIGMTPARVLEDCQVEQRHTLELFRVWWCADRRAAEAIAEATVIAPEASPDQVNEAVLIAARRLGLQVLDPQIIRKRVRATVDEIEARLADMKARGELRPINRAFQALREGRAARGRQGLTWNAFWRFQVIRMIRETALTARARVEVRTPPRAYGASLPKHTAATSGAA